MADPVHGFAAAAMAGVEYGLKNVACHCHYKTIQLALNTMEIKTYRFALYGLFSQLKYSKTNKTI